MNSKLSQPWIPIARIEPLIQIEPAMAIIGMAISAWLIYRVFLRSMSEERHQILKRSFSNLMMHMSAWSLFFGVYVGLQKGIFFEGEIPSDRLLSYMGLAALLSGAIVFVKTCRILLSEYLFLGHMKVGVPLLLVNLFTLLLSICVAGWIVTEVFNVRLTPLLATSAIFSLILGLALQDTLGNLFAGVALQLDKPYEIGDWVEIHNGPQKLVGQVREITWRATVLIGLSEEALVVPNRTVGQAQVSNFSRKGVPLIRSQIYKLPYGISVETARKALLQSLTHLTQVRANPAPLVLLMETNESWLTFKLVYWIDDYGAQFIIGNLVNMAVLESLEKAGLKIAAPRLQVMVEQAVDTS